tara:strand:+ start:3891 stop:4568 length:678 start_codon:yes stop_codon:yes gene_type:complete
MATYIPQMNTQTSRNNWGQSVANNLLDAVQKNRAFELQENQFENQKAQQEITNARAERQMGLEKQRLQLQQNADARADRGDARTQEVFDLKKKQMNDEKELAQILIKNKLDKSKYTGEINKDADKMKDKVGFWNFQDLDDKGLFMGAPDEEGKATSWYKPWEWQYKTNREIAKQQTKARVGDKPKLPEDTYKFINNIGMLGMLPELVQDNDQTGNYLYNELGLGE